MEHYIISFIFFYIFLILSKKSNGHDFVFIVVGALPLIFLAVFRGSVGTDTESYLGIIAATKESPELINIEPFFQILSTGLMFLFDDEKVALAIIGLLITVILFFSSYKLEKSSAVFGACVIPIFYQAMTMNGVRYGLSFSVVMLASVFFLHGYKKFFFLIAVIAGLIHLSGLLLAVLFFIYIEKNIKFRLYFSVIVMGFLFLIVFGDIFLTKIPYYIDYKSPSVFSGISILLLSFLAIYVLGGIDNSGFNFSSRVFLILLFAVLAFVLSKFSYAGLRFQSLVLFLIILIIQYEIADKMFLVSIKNYAVLVSIGLLGLGFNFNNYVNEDASGESPFIPYRFVWDK